MPSIAKDALAAIQPELLPGEKVLWAGRPSPKIVVHDQDVLPLLFGFPFGIAAIYWVCRIVRQVSHHDAGANFSVLPVVPLLIAQYFTWGRLLQAGWKKKRTYYAVTARRVIVVQNFFGNRVTAANIDSLPPPVRESRNDAIGTIRFTPMPEPVSDYDYRMKFDPLSMTKGPVLLGIEDVDSVCQLISVVQAQEIESRVSALRAKADEPV